MHKGQSDMKTKRYAKILAFSFFSAFAFFLNYQIVEPGNDFDLTSRGLLRVFKLLVAILDSIEFDSVVCMVVFVGLIFFYKAVTNPDMASMPKAMGIPAVILAFFRTGSELFWEGEDLTSLAAERSLLVKFVIKEVGYAIFFFYLIKDFCYLLSRLEADSKSLSFGKYAGILGVGWLPNLIIRYPGAICWDAWAELYAYRNGKMSAHAPMAYTVLIGKVITLFEKLGNAGSGLFLLVTIQYISLVCVFAYMFCLIGKLKMHRYARAFFLVAALLNPYITAYIGVLMYDLPYTAMVTLFICCLIDLMTDTDTFLHCRGKLVLLAGAIIGSWLLRKNGPYVILATVIVFGLYAVIRDKKLKKGAAVMIAACICAIGINGILNAAYKPSPDSRSSALSLPLQQLARVCARYDKEISDADKAAIDKVVSYDDMILDYNARISDPIKDDFKDTASKEELAACMKVWFKLLKKHPLTCSSATWEQNYYFFMPEICNMSIYQDTNMQIEQGLMISIKDWTVYYESIFEEPSKLTDWKRFATAVYIFMQTAPIINTISSIPFYTYLLLLLICYVIVKKQWRKMPALIPGIMVVLIAVAAPVILGHPRYVFPMIYSMPVIVSYCAWQPKTVSDEAFPEADRPE